MSRRALLIFATLAWCGGWLAAAETNRSSQEHWSFQPLTRPAVPAIPSNASTHPIDAFIRAKLAGQKLVSSPAAGRLTLLRRVYFDLIGLPPTPVEMEEFLKDKSPDAYDHVVDRLLASP